MFKLFDITPDRKVVIHSDTLGIPCFKKLWENKKYTEEQVTNFISYIVFKNKYSSPYVKSVNHDKIESLLKDKIFNDEKYKLPDEVINAEEEYKMLLNTFSLRLLRGARLKLESVAEFYENSLSEELDDEKVKKILSGMSSLGGTIKSIDTLESSVMNDELQSTRIRGGGEANIFELPNDKL